LIGVRWLMSLLYPQQFADDLRQVTKTFYKLFYQVELSEEQIGRLLASATASKK
jgi:iron complex transport system substrate-binding protein